MKLLCTTYHSHINGILSNLKNKIFTSCLLLCSMLFWQSNLSAQVTPNEGEVQCLLAGTGAIFTDFGGLGGNYLNCDCVTTTTICTPDGSALTAEFTSFGVFSPFDWLVILDAGNSANVEFPFPITDDSANANLQLFNNADGIGDGNSEAYGAGAELNQGVFADLTTTSYTSTNPTGCLTFVFRASNGVDDSGWAMDISAASGAGHPGDNLACGSNMDCSPPVNVQYTTGGTIADVIWEASSEASTYTLEYGSVGFTPGTGTIITTSDLFATISGLNPVTDYAFYIQADCDGDGLSVNLGPFIFTTTLTCSPPTDLVVSNITASSVEVSWTAAPTATSYVVEYGPIGFISGTGMTLPTTDLSATISGLDENTQYDVYVLGDCGAVDGLSPNVGPVNFITDFINPPQSCAYTLNLFDDYGDGWNGGILTVTHNGISTDYTVDGINDDGLTATFEVPIFEGFSIDLSYVAGGYPTEVSYELLDPNGTVIFADGPEPAEGEVFSAPAFCPDCPVMNGDSVTFTNITFESATVNWMGLDSALTYTIEWGLNGFMLGSGTVENTTETSFDLTNLAENTPYDVYLFANCSTGDGIPIGPFTFQSDFTSLPQTCSYTVNLFDSFGDGWNGSILTITQNGISTDYTIVDDCIDDDGLFATFDFAVLEGLPIELNYTAGAFQGEVTYELLDPSGTIVFSDGPNPATGIVFTEAAICPDCPNLEEDLVNFTNVTFNEATINWMGLDSALTYTLEWGLGGFALGNGTIENTGATSFSFSGLTENTLYDVYLFANCSTEDGVPVGPFTFQTAFINPPEGCTYTLQLNDTGFGNAGWDGSFVSITINNITTEYTLNCLENNGISETFAIPIFNGFDIQVGYTQFGFNGFSHNYTLFDSDGVEVYSAGPSPDQGDVVFETVGFCPDCPAASPLLNFQALALTDFTANLSWSPVSSAMNYIIEYGPTGFPLGEGLTITSTADSIQLTGLNPCVTYDAYVTVDCGGDGFSTTIGALTFTTTFSAPPNDCPIVLDAFMQDVNANNATVEWMADLDATGSYIVEYGTLGFTLGDGISQTLGNSVSSYTMNNLAENTWYNVYITTDCVADTSKTFGPISFQTLWLNDVGVGVIANPTDGSCNLSANETVTIGLTNFGQNPQSLFEYYFAVNGQLAPVSPPSDGFFTGVVGNDSTLLVDFETFWDFSVPGFYVIEAWTNLDNDSNSSNDTLRIEIVTAFPLPLMEDFEESEVPQDWTTDGFIFADGAHNNETVVLGRNLFIGGSTFTTTTKRYGPINDGDSLSFDYRYTVWSTGTEGLEIGTNTLEVQVSEDCMDSWTTVLTIDTTNHVTSAMDTTRFVDLSAYAGSALNIRFVGFHGESDYWLDLDNINILGCPPNLGLQANVDNPTAGMGNDGSIGLAPMFGTGPYDFEWNTNDNTATISDLGAGEYIVTVTDAMGCQDIQAYVLDEVVSASEVEAIQNIVLSPNPTTGQATLNLQLNRSVDVDIQVFNVTGQVIKTVSQRQISNLTQDFDLTNEAAGMYFVRVMIEGQSHYERLVLTK